LGAIETYGLQETDRLLQFGSFSYDGHVEEVYPILLCGGTLVLRDDEMLQSFGAFSQGCERRAISVITLPTGFWHEWTRALETGGARVPARVRLVILGGESVQPERIRAWLAIPDVGARLINSYGPTETTVVATAVELTAAHGEVYRSPIGRPLPGVQVKVVDGFGRLSPPGVNGELWIAGASLARGYLGREDQTARAFVLDPQDGQRWYRTGDRVRWRSDGSLEFVGRVDEQVKIRGFRVEPGEIQAAIIQHPLVERAEVLPFATDSGPRLAAYLGLARISHHPPTADADPLAVTGPTPSSRLDVVSATPSPSSGPWAPSPRRLDALATVCGEECGLRESVLDLGELRAFLKRRLPDFMIPARFVLMSELPLNSSGKVARELLPDPVSQAVADSEPVGPSSDNERRMIDLWQQILEIERVGRDDDFFALGGDSLSALRLIEGVRRAFGVEVGLGALFTEPCPGRLMEHVEELLAAGALPEAPPIEKSRQGERIPLSLEQEHFYFLTQLNPGSAAYNLHTRLRLVGPLDMEALSLTLREIMRRHEILRTRFVERDGRPLQQVEAGSNLDWHYLDLTATEPAARRQAVEQLATSEATTGFDLAARAPLRMRLLRLAEDEHLLLLTAHHILLDAWSLPILIREVAFFYSAFSRSQQLAIRKPAIQFSDFAIWQRQQIAGERLETLLDYWRRQLANVKPLVLPTDRPRPAAALTDSRTHRFTVAPRLAARVRSGARRAKTTPFVLMLTAFELLLHRYGGETDIAVGVPISGRGRREIADTVGCFVNTLVIRSNFTGDPLLEQALARVNESTRDAFSHQELPFHLLVQELRPERVRGRNPLFQALFNFHQESPESVPVNDAALAISVEEAAQPHSGELDLVLTVQAGESEMAASFGYNGELFDAATIARMAEHWQLLLDRLEGEPQRSIGSFPLLREAERACLLNEGCGPSIALGQQLIPQLFENACTQYSDAPAIVQGERQLSYRQMGERVEALAAYLLECGVRREERVAVALSPSPDLAIALLAVQRAGGAILPIDPRLPGERLKQILQEGEVRIGFADEQAVSHFQAAGVRVLATDPGKVSPSRRLPVLAASDLAYCIFTSGSTGRPKGVLVEHGSLLNAVWSFIQSYSLGPGDRLLHQTSLSFDVALNEILPPLCAGATVVMPEDVERWEVPELVRLVERQQISVLAGVPALLAHLDAQALRLPSLRLVLSGGESLAYETIPRLRRRATVTNGYGPTETTICASYHDLSGAPEDAGGRVPIGRPLPNYRIYILDGYGQLAPIGVPGELCIAGIGVARGYLARPEEEASRFVADPFHPGQRMYRSGDLARWRADGELEFLGRIDRQIKVRGVRIEPAEIESAILAHPAARQAAVQLSPGGRLVVFVAVDAATRSEWESSAILIDDLRSHLRRLLPAQYQPADFELLAELPLTLNGKVDSAALPDCRSLSWGDASQREAQTPTEERIAEIWSQCLAVSGIGRTDDFFSLGGHSLLAVETVTRMNAQLGIDLPVAALFEHPRLCDLAARVDSAQDPALAGKRLWPLNDGWEGTPFFCLHGVGGLVTGFWGLGRQLAPRPVYGVAGAGLYGEAVPEDSIEVMAEGSLLAIREVQPHGPYLLGGWSMGGWIATEIARSLRAEGEEVALLVLLDAALPNQAKAGVLHLDWLGGRIDAALDRTLSGLTQGRVGRLLRQYGVTGGVDEALAVRLQAVIEAHRKALATYRPHPYEGPVVYWQAEAGAMSKAWQRLFPQLRVEGGAGDHFSMLREPAVVALGAALKESMSGAERT